ncbi:MAG: BamA/TamA family outer membrane protein [Holosporaceae bacterium]|nr:BamA/TamA family outer membrane protein [Holosporaceae bacterium]
MLKKYVFFVLLGFSTMAENIRVVHTKIIPCGLKISVDDMRDFYYKANLYLTKDESVLGALSGIFSDSEIEEGIKELRTFGESSRTVSNITSLVDRVDNDVVEIYNKAHILGFFGAAVKSEIELIDEKHTNVKIYVNLGKQFDLKLNLKLTGVDENFNTSYQREFEKIFSSTSASISEIKNVIGEVIFALQSDGFFDPTILEKRVYLDYEKKIATLNLVIDPKQKVRFYYTKIDAFPGISTEFIKNRIEWTEGKIFDTRKIKQTTESLQNMQIFSQVSIEPMKEKIVGDKVPILIKLTEDKKHLIDFSLLYSSMRNMNFDKKSQTQTKLKSIIARASWVRNNAFGGGEKLRFTVEGTPMKVQSKRNDYSFEVTLAQPDIMFHDNAMESIISRRQELTNVFFKKSDKISVMFRYPLSAVTLMRIGCSAEDNYIDGCEVFFRNAEDNRRYHCLHFPLEFIFDNTDDFLDPTEGYRSSIKFCYTRLRGAQINALYNLDLGFSYNYALDELKKNVLSFFVAQKNIIGNKIDDIPLDKRLYAGGMNSTRGYAYQMASEMVLAVDSPMGGKFSLEFGAEIRRKISQNFGLVIFSDGAKISQNRSQKPYLQTEPKRWFFSVGAGMRYFTSIGPVRIDFAFPLRRRKGIDSKMQFIISLGQAF